MPCTCNTHFKRKPDLVYFYTTDINKKTQINEQILGDSVIISFKANLQNSKLENVGKLLAFYTSFDVNKDKNKKFPSINNITFVLPNGSINLVIPTPNQINPQGKLNLPAGLKIVSPIASGTGMFLNAKGYLLIHTKEYERKVEIFLKK